MNRQKILDVINATIIAEGGVCVTETQLLKDCALDSIGYVSFWLTLESKGFVKSVIEIERYIDYSKLTVSSVIDYIVGGENTDCLCKPILNEYEIHIVDFSDAIEIKKLISKSKSVVKGTKVLPEILSHIHTEDSLAIKLVSGDKIVGVWLSKEFDTHISLSYFYLVEDVRKKLVAYTFFVHCYNKLPNKALVLEADSTIGFEKYIEPIEDGQYLFKGFD